MRFDGYLDGVNVGGWISQYFTRGTKEHFDTFITEDDIKKIASWGMDHVRLPIDYPILEDDDNPFQYKEEGFAYVDKCIEWCQTYGLNLILDLHKTAGYAFHSLGENQLFEVKELQDRFVSLWEEFARRYKGHGRNLVFELLNEIVEPDSTRWNLLSRRAVEAIRAIDKDRLIIIGGNHYNSVNTLKELDVIDDPNVVYTFHFYEPHIFTHQKAGWEPMLKEMDFDVPYPSGLEDYAKYMEQPEEFRKRYILPEVADKEYLRKFLQPALEFGKERGVRLYCGEYGVIITAPLPDKQRWHKDFTELLAEYDIGGAVWTYKEMDFPFVRVER